MKKLMVSTLILMSLMVANSAMAIEEIKDVALVDYKMNHDKKECSLTIDRDIPTNASTDKCTQRTFSWKCFNDDYLWHMVLHIHKNQLPIDIRYSTDKCFEGESNNFQLLTVW